MDTDEHGFNPTAKYANSFQRKDAKPQSFDANFTDYHEFKWSDPIAPESDEAEPKPHRGDR